MKVLFIHNYYRSDSPSGEDAVARNERKLLEDNGITVISYEKFNDDIDDSNVLKKIGLAVNTVWSRSTRNEVAVLLHRERPDIAHVHSIHPQLSPSVYAACRDAGVPVVHTLHNYRYICPGALLQRGGKPCEDCVGRVPVDALRYRCFRGSLSATAALAAMLIFNRLRGTFANEVNQFIALTDFAKSRFVAGGLPAERITIKPNFLPAIPETAFGRKSYAVFVGRLSAEKGVKTLLTSWRSVAGLPLKVIGDGPLRGELESLARESGIDVEFTGALSRDHVIAQVREALLQVVPSEWYEGFPMVIVEALACGTPVIASCIGSLAEIIQDGETGLHFEPGNSDDLAQKVNHLVANPELAAEMGKRARRIFMEKYTAERNFRMLMGIYEEVIAENMT